VSSFFPFFGDREEGGGGEEMRRYIPTRRLTSAFLFGGDRVDWVKRRQAKRSDIVKRVAEDEGR